MATNRKLNSNVSTKTLTRAETQTLADLYVIPKQAAKSAKAIVDAIIHMWYVNILVRCIMVRKQDFGRTRVQSNQLMTIIRTLTILMTELVILLAVEVLC